VQELFPADEDESIFVEAYAKVLPEHPLIQLLV
jgi:hypothetical protein